MKRLLLSVVAAVAAGGSVGRAETVPVITNAPEFYQPGSSFTFDVRAPGLFDVTSFSVALLATVDNAFAADGTTPLITLSVAQPDDQFPFPGTTRPPTTGATTSQQVGLTFGGTGAGPVTTVAGVNDRLGVVTVQIASGFTGPINFSFDSAGTSFTIVGSDGPTTTNPLFSGTALVNPDPNTGGPEPSPVPTPAGWLSMAVGSLGLVAVGRRRRGEVVG